MNKVETDYLQYVSIVITNLPFDVEVVNKLRDFFQQCPHVKRRYGDRGLPLQSMFKPYRHSCWGEENRRGWVMYIRKDGDLGWDFQDIWESNKYSDNAIYGYIYDEAFDYTEL